MNRIPKEREEQIVAAARSGLGVRAIVKLLGQDKNTTRSVLLRNGIVCKRGHSARDRRAYHEQYESRQPINHYQRLKRLDKIHGHTALWLAKIKTPQSLEKIHEALQVQFPDLKITSIKQMLVRNSWGCYVRMQNKFTYKPSSFFSPLIGFTPGKLTKYPEMEAARAIYLQQHGIPDVHIEQKIQELQRQNDEYVQQVKQAAITKSIPQLQMLATAVAIGQHYDSTQSK